MGRKLPDAMPTVNDSNQPFAFMASTCQAAADEYSPRKTVIRGRHAYAFTIGIERAR
jgi:hypothetical protein